MYISVVVCDDCNMACTYCFEHNKTQTKVIALNDIEDLISEVYSNKNPMHLTLKDDHCLSFTGGEPTLHMDIISKATEFFISSVALCSFVDISKIKICIVTNGLLINTEEVQNYLYKYKDILQIVYSIDGIKEIHNKYRYCRNSTNTFDLILDNIKNHSVTEDKQVRGVLVPEAIPYLLDIYKFWTEEHIVYAFYLARLTENRLKNQHEVLKDQFHKILEWYKNQPSDWVLNNPLFVSNTDYKPHFTQDFLNTVICRRGGIVLDLNGNILRCIHLSNIANKNILSEYVDGNIREKEQINWSNLHSSCRYRDVCSDNIAVSDCYRCPIGGNCGKCKVENYELHGDVNTWSKEFCDIKAFLYMLNVFFHNYWILIYKQNTLNPSIAQFENDVYYYDNDKYKHSLDLLIPEIWALDVIYKDDYTVLKDLTFNVGGKVNELETRFYTEEQVKQLKQMLEQRI